MAKTKKKEYRNKYKQPAQNVQAAEKAKKNGADGKKKPTFKSFFVGASIIGGFAAFFMNNQIVAAADLILFVISGVLMGKQNLAFLGLGAFLGLLIAILNQADVMISIALVWALFYTVLMLSGFFFMRRAKK